MMPIKTPGIYGSGEIIVILMRFNLPISVLGFPYLELQVGINRIGKALYVPNFNNYKILFDLLETDIIFNYTVMEEDETVSLSHSTQYSLQLNGSQILRKSSNSTQHADILLRDPRDSGLLNGKVERQWLFRFPKKIEILFRDLYHSNPHSLKVSAEHSGKISKIFSNSDALKGKTFGFPFPKSKLNNNYTVKNTDSAIGYNYFFSDTISDNIGLKYVLGNIYRQHSIIFLCHIYYTATSLFIYCKNDNVCHYQIL